MLWAGQFVIIKSRKQSARSYLNFKWDLPVNDYIKLASAWLCTLPMDSNNFVIYGISVPYDATKVHSTVKLFVALSNTDVADAHV